MHERYDDPHDPGSTTTAANLSNGSLKAVSVHGVISEHLARARLALRLGLAGMPCRHALGPAGEARLHEGDWLLWVRHDRNADRGEPGLNECREGQTAASGLLLRGFVVVPVQRNAPTCLLLGHERKLRPGSDNHEIPTDLRQEFSLPAPRRDRRYQLD